MTTRRSPRPRTPSVECNVDCLFLAPKLHLRRKAISSFKIGVPWQLSTCLNRRPRLFHLGRGGRICRWRGEPSGDAKKRLGHSISRFKSHCEQASLAQDTTVSAPPERRSNGAPSRAATPLHRARPSSRRGGPRWSPLVAAPRPPAPPRRRGGPRWPPCFSCAPYSVLHFLTWMKHFPPYFEDIHLCNRARNRQKQS